MSRLFLAVWPPDGLAEELRGLPRKERPGIRWIPPENWHVTLRFLGEADADEIADRLDHVTLPAADGALRPGDRPAVAADDRRPRRTGSTHSPIRSPAPRPASATTAPRRFVGHLTVARVKRGGRIPDVIGLPVAATDA